MQTADVIAEYLDAAADGRVRDEDGRPYGREELRALRGALSHVAFDELGIRDVEDVRDEEVQALISRLREAGVPDARLAAIAPALRSLFAYAMRERLAAAGPVTVPPPRDEPSPAVRAATPTTAMLSLTEHALTWTVRMIVVATLFVVVALVIALS
jgi:site-specific recombinase XerD